MDDRRFDHLARALGGASSRRSAIAALLGIAGGASSRRSAIAALLGIAGGAAAAPLAPDAEAGNRKRRKRRRKCDPACPADQTCRDRTCTCDNGGTVCGANCCPAGQACREGSCVSPDPACVALDQPCKDTGRVCCGELTCASGQGGLTDIACYAPAGTACATTADCVYDTTCVGGSCLGVDHPCNSATVCASGCPFSTIEEAIAAAKSGDIITVAPGTYRPVPMIKTIDGIEYVVYLDLTEKSLTLRACDPGRRPTVVVGDGPGALGSDRQARAFANPIAALLGTIEPASYQFNQSFSLSGFDFLSYIPEDQQATLFRILNSTIQLQAGTIPNLIYSLQNLSATGFPNLFDIQGLLGQIGQLPQPLTKVNVSGFVGDLGQLVNVPASPIINIVDALFNAWNSIVSGPLGDVFSAGGVTNLTIGAGFTFAPSIRASENPIAIIYGADSRVVCTSPPSLGGSYCIDEGGSITGCNCPPPPPPPA